MSKAYREYQSQTDESGARSAIDGATGGDTTAVSGQIGKTLLNG